MPCSQALCQANLHTTFDPHGLGQPRNTVVGSPSELRRFDQTPELPGLKSDERGRDSRDWRDNRDKDQKGYAHHVHVHVHGV